VHCHDPHAELLHPPDRAALVPAGADEEDGFRSPHRGATLLAGVAAGSVTVADVAHGQTQLSSDRLRVQLREEHRACSRAALAVAGVAGFLERRAPPAVGAANVELVFVDEEAGALEDRDPVVGGPLELPSLVVVLA